MADSDLLYKALYHLIVNAIKYTPDGGEITISGSVVQDDDGREAVQVVVADTGIGIDQEHHALIFDKFYQTGEVMLHSSGVTKFKGGGPGLGLAIAKGAVMAHGGEIWVESEGYDEEKLPGSRFLVRLPLLEWRRTPQDGTA
jgi:signal transduction histidine kinase